MASLIIDHRDVTLDYEQECVLVRQRGVHPRSIPIKRLHRIQCMHNTGVSTRLLGQCHARGIDFIVINSRSSRHCFALHANHVEQCQRRINQYLLASGAAPTLLLARRLVQNKLTRSRLILKERTKGNAQDKALSALQAAVASAEKVTTHDELRGVEGSAQRAMFSYWRTELPDRLGFYQRLRRPPPDPVNALLSLSFTLIYHEAIRQCYCHGLDPWLGVYHLPSPGRRSLACDLVEPLRPAIESWVVDCFLEGEFDASQFSLGEGHCMLGKQGRTHFYEAWQSNLGDWSRRLGRYAALLARIFDGREEFNQGTNE